MLSRQDEPSYQSTSTLINRTPLPDAPRGAVGSRQAGLPAPSSIQGSVYPGDSHWAGARDPAVVGNYPQYSVPITSKEALEAASGIVSRGPARQAPPGRAEVFSGHSAPADGRLAYDTAPYGQPRSIATSPGAGYQGGPSGPPSAERDVRSDPGAPLHGSSPHQLLGPQYTMSSKQQMDFRSPSLALRDRPHPQGPVPQYHVLDSGPPGHYIPEDTRIPAPAGAQDMTVYPSGLQTHGPPGELDVSVEPAYPHPAGGSPHPPIYQFSGAAQSNEQAVHPQDFEGQCNYSFSPNGAPQFGLRPPPQYSMADLAPQSSLSPQSYRPPLGFTYQQPSQDIGTPDPQYQQQALVRGHAGKYEEVPHGARDADLSDIPHVVSSSGRAKRGTEPDAGHEPVSRPKSQQKQRGALSPEARHETSATRRTGACIRCRIQRARVGSIPSPVPSVPSSPELLLTCPLAVQPRPQRPQRRVRDVPPRGHGLQEGRPPHPLPPVEDDRDNRQPYRQRARRAGPHAEVARL